MIDPVELAMVGPLVLGLDGVEQGMGAAEMLGFTEEHFTAQSCRALWLKSKEWFATGGHTPEKVISYILNEPIFGQIVAERSMWLSEAGQRGGVYQMTTNALELIERKLKQETLEAVASVPKGRSDEMLAELENRLGIIRAKARNQNLDEKTEACRELIEELEAAERGEITIRTSRVHAWDKALGGLPNAQLMVLCGRPGGGKTSLAEQIIDEALRAGEPVLYVQRELSRSRAVGRLAARKTGIPWSRVELKKLRIEESHKIKQSVIQYRDKLPLHLAKISNCNASTIGPLIKFHACQHGCKIVVMDYIQLIDIPRGVERRVAIGDLTVAMKRAANETGATVIAIAQLDRGLDKSAEKPRLADLRESGDIEQNADSVLALWTSKERDNASRWPINWSILKNRNGPLNTQEVMFDGPSMSFVGLVEHTK